MDILWGALCTAIVFIGVLLLGILLKLFELFVNWWWVPRHRAEIEEVQRHMREAQEAAEVKKPTDRPGF